MYSHHPKQQQSILSRSLPPTPTQLHHPDLVDDDDDGLDDYLADQDDVPLPFLIKTIVADPQTGLSLTLVSALGAGSYAVVYLAKEVASGTLYALKCLGKDKLTDEEVGIQRNEVSQSGTRAGANWHRNIVHLFNMFETTDHLFLLLEYCSGMDMYQWISMRSDRSDPVSGEAYSPKARFTVIKSIFDQALEGVAQVHQRGIAHRDLKPENFLVEFVDGQYIVKLTDFGLATTDSESDEFECGSKPYMSFGNRDSPPPWSHPNLECRNGVDAVYDVQKADMWSLGIILINLLYHRCPWSDP
ncbi:kinase-like domain-containing protein, partial [Mortierella sp. GBAus27b]